MSLRALTWALEHPDCPSPAAKLVLIAFANFVSADDEAWPSTVTIASLTSLDVKTVRAAIDALEDEACGLIRDTGRRVGRTGQIKVYALVGMPERHPKTDGLQKTPSKTPSRAPGTARQSAPRERHPELGGFKGTRFREVEGTQKREAEPVTDPVTPNAPDGALPPGGGRAPGRKRIDAGWTPPAIADLTEHARAVAAQWPANAYAAQAEGFLAASLAGGLRRVDWDAEWAAHIVRIGARPHRDAQAGVRHAAPRTAPSAPVDAPATTKPGEGAPIAAWRAAVLTSIGQRPYTHWIDPLEARLAGDELELIAPTPFAAARADAEYGVAMTRAAEATLGAVRVRVVARRAAA